MECNIKDAIERLYEAFADIPKPHFVHGCPCCIARKEIGVLLSKPLGEISPDELAPYAASVFLTVGNEADFQYFLPRIFELSAIEKDWYPCPEVVLGKLKFIQWQEWSKEKRVALESFLELAFVNFVLQQGNDPNSLFFGDEADTWLCAIARTGLAIESFLDRIKINGDSLIAIYEQNSTTLIKGKLSNGFWDDIPHSRQSIIKWFQSPEIEKLIKEQYQIMHNNQNHI